MQLKCAFALALLPVLGTIVSPVWSQEPGQRLLIAQQFGRGVQRQPPKPMDSIVLSHDVALPNLPAFGGKTTFLMGMAYTNVPGALNYFLKYGVTQEPQQVLQWYRQALTNFGWALRDTGLSSNLTASKNGSSCSISIMPGRGNQYRAVILIKYFQPPQKQ